MKTQAPFALTFNDKQTTVSRSLIYDEPRHPNCRRLKQAMFLELGP